MKFRLYIQYTFEANDHVQALDRASQLVQVSGYKSFDHEVGDLNMQQEREYDNPVGGLTAAAPY